MIKLVVDIGNTLTKVALFREDELLEIIPVKKRLPIILKQLFENYEIAQSAIISSVQNNIDETETILIASGIQKVITMRSGLKLPVKVLYKTPETLGTDRLANVCGAVNIFPGANILVIDSGTCVKYDLLTSGNAYLGGGISPGLKMRYKALSQFTAKLPYLKPDLPFPMLIGQSTEGSIRSGVENGILEEMQGIIQRYGNEYESLKVVVTGGDYTRFADKLKSPIFAAPNLTINGLKVILDYNDH